LVIGDGPNVVSIKYSKNTLLVSFMNINNMVSNLSPQYHVLYLIMSFITTNSGQDFLCWGKNTGQFTNGVGKTGELQFKQNRAYP